MALIFARTETKMFFSSVWGKADAVLFIKGRIKFFNINGKVTNNAGAPSVIVAYGKENARILEKSKIKGKFLWVKN